VAVEHTPATDHVATAHPIIERKQKPDGTIREYRCTLLHLDAALAVVEFVMEKGGVIHGTPIEVPPGSVSRGYFWKRRPYNLYRMHRADGTLIGHRFDAVAGVRLSPDVIFYRDLVLDWWVTPDDTLIEEDRDEFDAMVAAGTLAPGDIERAEDAARTIFSRYRHIIDDVVLLERRLGIRQPR
jgi:predicted RNA-binding protein associated with RNAse of E/G family